MRLLLFILAGYILYKILKSAAERKITQNGPSQATDTHRDPVCGVYVSDEEAVIGTLGEERVYFCSRTCLEKFRERLPNNSK